MSELLQSDYIAGFVDGEGCIEAKISKSPTSAIKYGIQPHIRISQRWLAGFFDAEGCITVHIAKTKEHNPTQVYPTTRLTLRECKDVLDDIATYLHDNDISSYGYVFDESVRTLVIWGVKDVERFLLLMEPHLRVKKGQANLMLYEIIPRMKCDMHVLRGGFLEIMTFIELLNQGRTKGKPRKYTLQYFESLWNLNAPPLNFNLYRGLNI